MPFPPFFDQVRRIRLHEPLAAFLGAGDGIIEYGYADAVKLAGHSCPTVAGAYLMTLAALDALYPGELPERGAVRVLVPEAETDGVAGVTAAVATLLTGAAGAGGFKGLAGRFARQGLLRFDADVPADLAFERLDGGGRVEAVYDSSPVPADPEMRSLLQAVLSGTGDAAAEAAFGTLWQDRVRRILIDHGDEVVRVHRVG
jgi:hypothetical protein